MKYVSKTVEHNIRLMIENVRKKFKNGIFALKSVSFNVNEGQICSIIGPNGAGKTTLLKIIAGLILPDEGRVLYCDGHYTYSIIKNKDIKKNNGAPSQ